MHAPAWGATERRWIAATAMAFQIHAPRVGSDPILILQAPPQHGFNPRSRVGSDGFEYCNDEPGSLFQSTLPRGERLIPRFLSNS